MRAVLSLKTTILCCEVNAVGAKMNYKLNVDQQELVEQHLDLVSIIIRKYISTNEQIRGLEYEDLYQYGCLALCKAAFHYDGRVKFETFAGTVIRNALMDECRKAKANYSHSLSYDASVSPDDDDGDTFFGRLGDTYDMTDRLFSEELMSIVQTAKKTHKGAVLKGIEAIELRIKGYTGAEIAEMYGVKNNNVTSWISKARVVLQKECYGY